MKLLIVANWKCNPITLREAEKLFDSIRKGIKNVKNSEVVICPPFVYLSLLVSQEPSSVVSFGGQSCFWEEKGAFTGEISPLMLKNTGIKYVIIGHSERRKYQKETDEMINKKLKAALKTGLKVILCIDNISQIPSFLRKRGGRRGRSPLRLKKDLSGLVKKELSNLIIAYEPIFAVGTGKPCSVEKANKMRILIKKEVLNKKIPILYGGSVNFQNAGDYIKKGGFQGLLIGGISLNAKEFIKIVKDIDLN
ncbi:MAG: triose-phosphate isomerase [Candidatus Nealsonbacteria bacterium]|nr:triose-phosphate isomerase [Candidatus Nealsonbacteria bacterium]